LRNAIKRHIDHDLDANRINTEEASKLRGLKKLIRSNAIIKLKAQQYRCAYSFFPLSILPSFARFSFERIDNLLPHFTLTGELTNIVFICRLFNGRRQMSRKKLLQYYMSQKLVEVPIEARQQAENELLLF